MPVLPRRTALTAALLLVAALPLGAQTVPQGRWTIDHYRTRDQLQLSFRNLEADARNESMTSFQIPASELQGLSMAALDGGGDTAAFRIVRDAGTIEFRGRIGQGLGIGIYTFTANPAFLGDLAKRGYGTASDREAFQLTIARIDRAFLERLDALHYARPTIGDLARMGKHGVSLEYLNSMAALGFDSRSANEITRLHDHGVTPEFVKELRAAGYADLEPAEYTRAKDHGVDAAMAREFAELGYRNLPMQTLIRMRDHGVTPSFAKAARRDGTQPTPEELVRYRDRGER